MLSNLSEILVAASVVVGVIFGPGLVQDILRKRQATLLEKLSETNTLIAQSIGSNEMRLNEERQWARDLEILALWETIRRAQGHSGNVGRIYALERLWNEYQQDLLGLNLDGGESFVHLREIQLPGVLMADAVLLRVNFRNSNLRDGRLDGTRLGASDLEYADWADVVLHDASFERVRIGEKEYYANVQNANLIRANMTNLRAWGASFNGSILSRVVAGGAEFIDCSFNETKFKYANLAGTKFRNCTFPKADFTNANLTSASIGSSSFKHAIGLTVQQVLVTNDWEDAEFDEDFAKELRLASKREDDDG